MNIIPIVACIENAEGINICFMNMTVPIMAFGLCVFILIAGRAIK